MFRPAALSVLLFSLLAGAQRAEAQVSADDYWPMFRHDPAHSGRSAFTGPEVPGMKWRLGLGSLAYSSPAIGADGTLYLGSAENVFAVSEEGEELWSFPVGNYSISSPALGEGVVYAGSWDHSVYALDAATGAEMWSFETGDEIWASPAIGPDGTVYVGSFDFNFYALDPGTGEPLWSFPTGGEVGSSAAIGLLGTLYFGSADDHVYALDPQGDLVWSFLTGGDVVSSPAIGIDGTIYVGSRDGNLDALSPNGTFLWVFSTQGEIILSPALAADGTIYVGSRDGRLYSIDPENGTELWQFTTEDEIISSPAIDGNGHVYVGSIDGRVYSLDGATGESRWSFPASGPVWSSPSIGDDQTIYFTANNEDTEIGTLFAVGTAPFEVVFPETPVSGETSILETRPLTESLPGDGMLFYRRGGERTFQGPVALTEIGEGTYEASIPPEFSTIRGIEYYVEFSDGEETATVPIFQPEERPAFQAVRVEEETAPITLRPARYEMISVPLHFDDGRESIANVLEDDYGDYLNTRWRLFRWENEGYQEHPNISTAFAPGVSYFLITNDGQPFDVNDGSSVSTAAPFDVVLEPGLNQVGNPYAFPIAWDDVQHDERVGVAATFDSETNQIIQDPGQLQVLEPWKGYFVVNNASERMTISFTPREHIDISQGGKRDALHTDASTFQGGSVINLQARIPRLNLIDTQNWIGFLPGANDAADARDFEEVPPIGDYVQLSIQEADRRWAGNFRAPGGAGAQWEFTVRTSGDLPDRGNLPVEVTLHMEQPLPDGFQVRIIDLDSGWPVAVEGNTFQVLLSRSTPERRLRVLAGTAAFVEDPGHVEDLAKRYALEQNYPNPFNPETTIRYQLESEAQVVLAVFNVLGRRVRTLVDEVQPSGPHEVVWNGLDDSGQAVASGVYLYQLSAGPYRSTRKMLLVR